MNRITARISIAAFCGLLATAGAVRLCAVQASDAGDAAAATALQANFENAAPRSANGFLGARSCAAAACHGSAAPDPRPGRIGRNEYLVWFDKDPHARASRTLTGERARRMLSLLGITVDGTVVDRNGYQNCLACHAPGSQSPENVASMEGVSCESCHGAAQSWIDEHYQAGWTASKAARLGMRDLVLPEARAELCGACHVGGPDREVNHDMIAAGHPPLKFELGGYHAALPKHWSDEQIRREVEAFELRLWAAGRRQSAAAALQLLHSRAERAAENPTAAWPELADYDCYACHHDLAPPESRRRQQGMVRTGRGRVAIPHSRWYGASLDVAVPGFSDQSETIRDLMQSGSRPAPNAVAQACEQLLDLIASAEQRSGGQTSSAKDAATKLLQTLDDPAARDWDSLTQHYLALAAADSARLDELRNRGAAPTTSDERRAELLRQIRRRLAFPDGYDSPRGFAPAKSVTGDDALEPLPAALREAAETFLAP